jgi:HEAT repeat protein
MRHEPLGPYMERLKDKRDCNAWYQNAMLVADFGTNASAAVPLLLESLQDTNQVIQAHALIALGMIRTDPQACVPAVLPFMSHPSVALRQKAIFTLLCFKTDAQSASNQIVGALSDTDPWMRSQALEAIKDVLPPPAQRNALAWAEALLNDPVPYVRQAAKKLLPKIRAASSP